MNDKQILLTLKIVGMTLVAIAQILSTATDEKSSS